MATTETRRLTALGIDPDAVERGLELGLTFPSRWYWDPAIFDLELDRVFPHSWILAAPLHRLSEPGDVVTAKAGHVPVVLTRDVDGDLHGFVNVCRHRAYPVAKESGNRSVLLCDYHAWTYDLDGSLRKAPGCELEERFSMDDFSLVPVAVEVWNGLVWVNVDPAAPNLAETFPELVYLEDRGFDFPRTYRHVETSTYEVAANWKVGVENTIECYHCPTIHSSTFGNAFDVDEDRYENVILGDMLCQFTEYNQASTTYRHESRPSDRGFRFAFLWPLTFITQDDVVAFTHIVVPTAPDRFTNVYELYANPEASDEEIARTLAMYERTLAEDAEVMALQQPGLRSGRIPNGRIMPSRESSISAFHRLVWRGVQQALSG